MADDTKLATESEKLFPQYAEKAKNGNLSKQDADILIKALSVDYKVLLEKIGQIEQCIESACVWRDSIGRDERLYRIATLPSIMARNMVRMLKGEGWAKIVYAEEPGTHNAHITDAARLVDIMVDPNMVWDGFVTFKIISRGYISRQDYEALMTRNNLGIPYFIS